MARIALMLLLLHFFLLQENLAISSSPNETLPGCQGLCGDVTIPYPFGIGHGCFREPPFEIKCNKINGTWRPFLSVIGNSSSSTAHVVTNIDLPHGLVHTSMGISYACYNHSGELYDKYSSFLELGNGYEVSSAHNTIVALGADTFSYVDGYRYNDEDLYRTSCGSFCFSLKKATNGLCTGLGCCQTLIPEKLTRLYIYLSNRTITNYTINIAIFNPCSYAFVVEKEWFHFDTQYLVGESFREKYSDGVPLVLEWTVGGENCSAAMKSASSYACLSNNSQCSDSTSGSGYTCNCSQGYQGNPYLTDGCQDIDECKEGTSLYPCNGICTNTEGSYNCTCPPGKHSKNPKEKDCDPDPGSNSTLPSLVKVALGVGIGFVSLIFISFVTYIEYQKRKLAKEKERYFKQNGGLILYEEMKSTCSTTTFKIFRKEELEQATNMFDNELILGRGGHGTVYLGTLEGNASVAIKKSRLIDENQKKEFVKEILILSQINHKNVVKLLGCCLEVEVPMLVYEFVPNGTLYEFIHVKNRGHAIHLDTRLRIAVESAEALAYLHSAATPPILHGDIKSSNILLGENNVARVSDFGASTLLVMDEVQLATVIQGTLGYLDPECTRTYIFTEKSDVYSFGVVILELLTRKRAFRIEALSEEERSLASYFLSLMRENRATECLDEELVNEGHAELLGEALELVNQCLSIKGEDRPTMKEVAEGLHRLRRFMQQHPWVEEQHHAVEIENLLGEPSVYHAADTTGSCGLDTSTMLNLKTGR